MSFPRTRSATKSQQTSVIAGPSMTPEPPMDNNVRPREVDYMEDKVQIDADLQVHWSNWMSDDKKHSSYKRVFVLLLSWHPECDDMAVDEEVRKLGSTFRDTYNFDVTYEYIDSRQKSLPQAQANFAAANFVHMNDQEDALFIVYYAGHGSLGKNMGDLNMSGRRRQNKQNVSKEFSHITWNFVESNFKTTRADVFLIFDCCHADNLRGEQLSDRAFEYLAASTSGYTPSPGNESFTSALIWALNKLATPSTSSSIPMFTTSKLARIVRDAPGFPEEQKPSLTTRDLDAYRHIILTPLPKAGDSDRLPSSAEDSDDYVRGHEHQEDEDEDRRPHYLSLTFHFRSEQDETDLKKLAKHLRAFMQLHNEDLQTVQWGGIWGGNGGTRRRPIHRFRDAVAKTIEATNRHRRSKSSISSSLSSYTRDSLFDNARRLAPEDENTPLLTESTTSKSDSKATHSFSDRVHAFLRMITGSKKEDRNPINLKSNTSKNRKAWLARCIDKLRMIFIDT